MSGMADALAFAFVVLLIIWGCSEKGIEYEERCRKEGGTPVSGFLERHCFAPGIILNIKPAEKK